ncbi:MAG: DNA internalization-related competence protein ComEC/Rec2, partial [Pontibacterium sp.]
MRSWMISLVCGLSAAVLLPQIPSLSYVLLTAFIAVILALFIPLTRCYFGFFLGFVWALLHTSLAMENRLPVSLAKQDITVIGYVLETKVLEAFTRYRIELSEPQRIAGKPLPTKLQITDYKGFDRHIEVGDRVELTVRLKPVHGFSNPHGFDYEYNMLQKQIGAVGYIKAIHHIEPNARCFIHCLRERLKRIVTKRYAALGDDVNLLVALTVGVKNFTAQQRSVLIDSGTVHLSVISGLHIGFVAGCAVLLMRLLSHAGLSVERWIWWLPIVAAFSYMMLAGAQLPTQRAFIMVAVFILCTRQRLYISLWSRWWLALALVLIIDPIAFHSMGLWLSFGAVAALIWGHQNAGASALPERLNSLLALFKAQWVIFFVMTPLVAISVNSGSWIAPIANLIAIPLVTLLIVSLVIDLLLSFVTVDLLLPLVEVLVHLLWVWCSACQGWVSSFAKPIVPSNIIGFVSVLVGSALLLQPRYWPLKWLGLVLWLPLLITPSANFNGDFEAWVFDVGQGTAVLIRSKNDITIYDTAARYRSGFSPFDHTLAPWLQAEGVERINTLILSHDDIDHTGGAERLKTLLPVDRIIVGQKETDPTAELCEQGMVWKAGVLKYHVLAGGKGYDDNDKSCVILVDSGKCQLLLTGDIGRKIEDSLVVDGELSWLLAPHHGSRFSSSLRFLRQAMPQ